jgi:hypothetical protein
MKILSDEKFFEDVIWVKCGWWRRVLIEDRGMDPDELLPMRGDRKSLGRSRWLRLVMVAEGIVKPWLERWCFAIDQELGRGVMDRLEQFSYHPFLKNFGKISEVKKSIMLDRCERSIDRIGGGFAIPCLPQASD